MEDEPVLVAVLVLAVVLDVVLDVDDDDVVVEVELEELCVVGVLEEVDDEVVELLVSAYEVTSSAVVSVDVATDRTTTTALLSQSQ